jgi:hypothetical protein
MIIPFRDRLKAVDAALLTPLVRQVLADDCAEVLDWNYAPLDGGMAQARGGSYGVYRFRGRACCHDKVQTWSLVLKATAAAVLAAGPIASAGESDAYYWKREVLVYQSGLLADLPEGLVAVRCFSIVEYPDQEFWIWLEDVEDSTWSRQEYGLAAYHLGQFNGAYLAGRPIPQASWLSTGAVRLWLEWGEPGIADIETLSRLPIHQLWLDTACIARIRNLWAQREQLLAALDRLPRTFCHFDTYRRNLMIRRNHLGKSETVAIDWAAAGTGGVGVELSALIGAGVTMYEISARELKEYEAVVFSGYMAGLRQAGWEGDQRLVRFGFAAAAALHYGLGLTGLLLSLLADEQEVQFLERFFARHREELMAEQAIFQPYFVDLGEEALALLEQLTAGGKL